ncbi:MAG: DNA polymerase I [Cytophagales bacterium]|nr:DNA polymerase I [Cytophagales bacterium]
MSYKIFLLDAMALIYRAHFAFSQNPRINTKGMNTGASFGFTNTMLEILQKEKPTHMAIAFDTAAPTFRHIQYADYKAQRQEQPEDITQNIPYIKRIISAFNIPILELDGYEADDIIGTLSKKFAHDDAHIYMMTSDKDYCQLVTEQVFVYKPAFLGKGPEVYDIPKVLDKFQIKYVDQVRDILGLQGDSVDNIPGIPGIGEKTAQKLISEYETVENLIKNADKLSGKLKENVVNFAQQGLQSKELATIFCEVPISVSIDDLLIKEINKDAVAAVFDDLEFRQLRSKILGENITKKPKEAVKGQISLFDTPESATVAEKPEHEVLAKPQTENIDTVIKNYYCMHTLDECKSLLNYLMLQTELCFDTETTSLNTIEAELVGISFSYHIHDGYYIPIPDDQAKAMEIVNIFKPVFENENIVKIGHNIKYDIMVLQNYGVNVRGSIFDTMLAHYIIEPDMRHGMDLLSKAYLNYEPISITTLIGKKNEEQGNMREADVAAVAIYAAEDADITLQLKHRFAPTLKQSGLESLFYDIETPLIYVLADMERAGVKIDTSVLSDYSILLDGLMRESESKVYELAGEKFLLSSPKQLGVILFEKLKLEDKPKKTETGQYATGEEVLSKLANEHEIASKILEYREYQKLKSTYVDALPSMISKATGLIHTSYNQAVAATGRLSSTNPNLQNIPIRTEKGKEIRKAFIPRSENRVILSADYSQIELRIMAAFAKDDAMITAFKNGVDIHSTTASKVFKVPLHDVNSEMRRKAKMVNFGIIYGISAFGLAQRLSISRTEAKEIIEAYWAEFPSVKLYMDRVIHEAHEKEYVTTILGRRRYLRDINSRNITLRGYAERNAINAPIQGTAADIIKKAMIDIHEWMTKDNLKSKMVLQVHDELVFDAATDELDYIKPKIEHYMKNAIILEVPMEIGIGTGYNWLQAH